MLELFKGFVSHITVIPQNDTFLCYRTNQVSISSVSVMDEHEITWDNFYERFFLFTFPSEIIWSLTEAASEKRRKTICSKKLFLYICYSSEDREKYIFRNFHEFAVRTFQVREKYELHLLTSVRNIINVAIGAIGEIQPSIRRWT